VDNIATSHHVHSVAALAETGNTVTLCDNIREGLEQRAGSEFSSVAGERYIVRILDNIRGGR
jgi:hypothetical protein